MIVPAVVSTVVTFAITAQLPTLYRSESQLLLVPQKVPSLSGLVLGLALVGGSALQSRRRRGQSDSSNEG